MPVLDQLANKTSPAAVPAQQFTSAAQLCSARPNPLSGADPPAPPRPATRVQSIWAGTVQDEGPQREAPRQNKETRQGEKADNDDRGQEPPCPSARVRDRPISQPVKRRRNSRKFEEGFATKSIDQRLRCLFRDSSLRKQQDWSKLHCPDSISS